jgi:hypothetical protein
MFLFFLKWFNPVKYAQIKSANTFNVFKQTVVSLNSINEQIEAHKQARLEVINKAQEEHRLLLAQQSENSKVVTKINEFFN